MPGTVVGGAICCASCWKPGALDADGLCSPACRTPKGRALARRLDWIDRHGAEAQSSLLAPSSAAKEREASE